MGGNATAAAGARERAIGIIRAEHRALAHAVQVLQAVTEEAALRGSANFALLASILYYLDGYPERCHHPKEDEHLFLALRRRTSQADAVLDELQAEHVRSARLMAYLHQTLVHYQGGAPGGEARFRDAVIAYAALHGDHMRKEEHRVLPLAEAFLRAEDWEAIAAAFATSADPLAGDGAPQEFGELRARIAGLAIGRARAVPRAAAIRDACVAAAIEGYESAKVSGLCHEGAWEVAIESIRRLTPDELADATAQAPRLAGP